MKNPILTAAIAAVLASMSHLGLAAETVDDVVVVANRAPEPATRVGNEVSVVDSETIRLTQALDVADLLATTPGISITRVGGFGSPTSVFVRGAESYQTVVMIDGVVMNDPSTTSGGFDFRTLMVGDISRMEVLRGAQSTLYGSDAIGGVVNITMAEPTGSFGGGFSAEGGSHATGLVSGNLGGKDENLLWRVAGSYFGTSGIPDFDEQLGGRRLCASQIATGSGQLRYDFTPQVQLDLRGFIVQMRTDFDGFDTPNYAFGDDNEYGKVQQGIGYAGLTVRSPDNSLTNRLAVQFTDSSTRNFDPNAPANYGSLSAETFYGIGRNLREEYQGTWKPGAASQLVFGAQHERATIDTDTPAFDLTPSPLDVAAVTNSAYAQLQTEVARGLTLTAGGRYDHHDVFGGHFTGQLAAAWALDGDRTIVRTSFGQGFKSPSLYQLYGNYGNHALVPEQANTWDVGVERRSADRRATVSLSVFERWSRELIGFFDCATPSPLCATEPYGYYANINRTQAKGVELEGSWNATERLALTGNFTYSDSEDRSPGAPTYGNQLPRRPKAFGSGSIAYHVTSQWTTSAALRYAGRSFDDAADHVVLGGYVLADVRAAYQMREGLELYARIENAGGRHYETAYQYGTLGRVGYVGFRTNF